MNSLSKIELIEQLFNYLGESRCACHVINCSKTRVLMWQHKTLANTFLLKIGDQLFISSVRSDKNGETYWKYRNFYEKEESEAGESSPPAPNAVEKFQQRQTKTLEINHENNANSNQS